MFLTILAALTHLHQYQHSHGSLSQDCIVRGVDKFFLSMNWPFLAKTLKETLVQQMQEKKDLFMAPEVFSSILNQDDLLFSSKDDLWSLSFVCLNQVDPTISEQVYDYKQKTFNWQLFDKLLVNALTKINYQNLFFLLKHFQSFVFVKDSQKRMDAEQFQELLQNDSSLRKKLGKSEAGPRVQSTNEFLKMDPRSQLPQVMRFNFQEPGKVRGNPTEETEMKFEEKSPIDSIGGKKTQKKNPYEFELEKQCKSIVTQGIPSIINREKVKASRTLSPGFKLL